LNYLKLRQLQLLPSSTIFNNAVIQVIFFSEFDSQKFTEKKVT